MLLVWNRECNEQTNPSQMEPAPKYCCQYFINAIIVCDVSGAIPGFQLHPQTGLECGPVEQSWQTTPSGQVSSVVVFSDANALPVCYNAKEKPTLVIYGKVDLQCSESPV